MTTNNKIILGTDKYTEKITCKKCGYETYRDLEKYNIYTEEISGKNLYALFIKKFICPQCKSEEFESSIIEGQLVTTQEKNIIKLPRKMKKKQDVYKVNVM